MQQRQRPSPVDRFLRLFTDLRGGESKTALLLALNIFFILTAYYFIKPVRDALIISAWGPEGKSYLSAGLAMLLLGAVPLFVVSRVIKYLGVQIGLMILPLIALVAIWLVLATLIGREYKRLVASGRPPCI